MLKYLWQLKKHIGRTLEIDLNTGEKVEGTLSGITEPDYLGVEIPQKNKSSNYPEQREINFNDVRELKVKISFSKNKKYYKKR